MINVSPSRPTSVRLLGLPRRARVYALDAPSLTSPTLRLNGRELSVGDDDQLPALDGDVCDLPSTLELAPATAQFLAFE